MWNFGQFCQNDIWLVCRGFCVCLVMYVLQFCLFCLGSVRQLGSRLDIRLMLVRFWMLECLCSVFMLLLVMLMLFSSSCIMVLVCMFCVLIECCVQFSVYRMVIVLFLLVVDVIMFYIWWMLLVGVLQMCLIIFMVQCVQCCFSRLQMQCGFFSVGLLCMKLLLLQVQFQLEWLQLCFFLLQFEYRLFLKVNLFFIRNDMLVQFSMYLCWMWFLVNRQLIRLFRNMMLVLVWIGVYMLVIVVEWLKCGLIMISWVLLWVLVLVIYLNLYGCVLVVLLFMIRIRLVFLMLIQ